MKLKVGPLKRSKFIKLCLTKKKRHRLPKSAVKGVTLLPTLPELKSVIENKNTMIKVMSSI